MTVDLKTLYKDDPQSIRKIDTYESQIINAKLKIENQQNIIRVKKHELGKAISDRPDIFKLVEKGKSKIVKIHGPQPPSGTPPGGHRHIPHDHDGDGIPDH